jgi:hypothetical protein
MSREFLGGNGRLSPSVARSRSAIVRRLFAPHPEEIAIHFFEFAGGSDAGER